MIFISKKKTQWILLLNSAIKRRLSAISRTKRRIIIFSEESTCHGLDAFAPFQMKDELCITVTVLAGTKFCFIYRDVQSVRATLFMLPTCSCFPTSSEFCANIM